MAGGIDWFRWHHGSVTDPKFQLVARKACVRLPDVLAVWAFVLEKASASEERGNFGVIDCEAVDCLFGLDEGQTALILEHMGVRGLVQEGRIAAWEKRQPKRERDADNSTDRTRAYRERQKQQGDDKASHVTPCDATERQKNARGEERREEEIPPKPPKGEEPEGFAAFWAAWPNTDRKQAKGKCLEAWKKASAERDAAVIVAHVETLKACQTWTKDGGQYIPAPLVYLNQRRWEGAEDQAASLNGVLPGDV